MKRERAAVGIANHNGWAILVCVSLRDGRPVVIDRRRVELLEPGLPNQPYHHETLELPRAQAEALVKEVRESARHCAAKELSRLQASLRAEIAVIGVREPVLPALPESVATAHASHFVLSRADAMIYEDAIGKAAAELGLGVERIPKGKERQQAADALRMEPEQLDRWLVDLRATLGTPWQKDHQDATARAIAAMEATAGLRAEIRRQTSRWPNRRR